MVEHGAEGCNYLLAVDVEMNTVGGYAMSSWERGYGDFAMRPDLGDAAAGALAGGHRDGPRRPRVGGRQGRGRLAAPDPARASSSAWTSAAGGPTPATELEFLVFRDTYEAAWRKGYRDLEPANLYNIDYSLLGTARVEPLIRRIRNAMEQAGLEVENSKGECNLGQHEINFRYADALRIRRRALDLQERRQGDRRPGGDGDQLHGQVRRARGQLVPHPLLARRRDGHAVRPRRREFESFLAGQLACLRELTLLYAPNVNSYKRYAAGSFAPTAVAWATDNRTCALRVVGHGARLRVENRPAAPTSTHTWR